MTDEFAIRDLHQRGHDVRRDIDALDHDWAHAAAIEGELVDFVRDLKQQDGGDVGVHGSISVAQALLAADAVDELRVAIEPMTACRRLLESI